jgi:hypothetical protein
LRDIKGSADVETMAPVTLNFYGRACGWTLTRAHARSGDPIAIAAYLGEGDQFDLAITDFAGRYADQNERDYQAFLEADPVREITGAPRRLKVARQASPVGSRGTPAGYSQPLRRNARYNPRQMRAILTGWRLGFGVQFRRMPEICQKLRYA